MRFTEREAGRLAELCRKLAGPLGPVTVAHMAHLALGLGLDALGAQFPPGSVGADVGAPRGSEEAVRVGEELEEVGREVRGLMGRVERATAQLDTATVARPKKARPKGKRNGAKQGDVTPPPVAVPDVTLSGQDAAKLADSGVIPE